jgi:CPA2 family monovalent cation:H+ antiporter-2
MPARVCIFTGLALCQIGEFSFILAKTGLDSNMIPEAVYQLFLAGAIITMALTPFAMNASPRVVDLLYRFFPYRVSRSIPGDGGSSTCDQIPSDHIIIAGYGVTGRSVARAAEITGIPYVVIELNPDIIRQEKAARQTRVIFGDAVQTEILEHAGIRSARTLVVVISEEEAIPRIIHRARALSPKLYIIARTRHIRTARDLLDIGADEVISEEFEAAQEIFTRALRKYQMPEAEITKIVGRLQTWGYAKFIKGTGNIQPLSGINTLLQSLRIHTLCVEPGSEAAGKTIAELELTTRFGIADYGLRRENTTIVQPDESTKLEEGDSLVIFSTDQKFEELSSLFSGK